MSPWIKGAAFIAAYCATIWCLMRLFRLNGDFDGASGNYQQRHEASTSDDTEAPSIPRANPNHGAEGTQPGNGSSPKP